MYVTHDLNQKLPANALIANDGVWNRYCQYPVFSRRWLSGRSLRFCAVIAAYSVISGLGVGLVSGHAVVGLAVAGCSLGGFGLIACLGPALATLVRHRNLTPSRERAWIVTAIVAGILLSIPVGQATSAVIQHLIETGMGELASVARASRHVSQPWVAPLNLIVRILLYALVGGGLALHAYFSEQHRWQEHHQRRELEAARARAEEADLRLGILQAQVEPHFLFNTLASIRVLMRQDLARAEATLDALVAFLRLTIPKLREQRASTATLGQQLELCGSYLDVMQIRMGSRFSYAFDVVPSLLNSAFPPSILITLVENAIKHGIEPKPGAVRIEVRAREVEGRLLVQVLDNGAGLQPGTGGGVGLANIREQLASLFGDGAGFRLHSLADGWTCAEVTVPRQART